MRKKCSSDSRRHETGRRSQSGCPGTDKEPLNNDITERLLDATGLLALERVEKRETERQYQDLFQSANNSEQVLILTEKVEQRRIENTALAERKTKITGTA